MMIHNYCVFILSYGRANNIATLDTLHKQGYVGEVFIVVSDDDPQLSKYKHNFKNSLVIFNREKAVKATDTDFMDNMRDYSGVICARNYLFEIAKEKGFDYFIELDDDYKEFSYRFPSKGMLLQRPIKDLNRVFDITFNFLDDSKAIVISWSQGGDLIGGLTGNYPHKILRKAMNSFFCKTDKPFKFFGRINEDANMYCYYNSRGGLVLQVTDLMINQEVTQRNEYGMTDLYLDYGTYLKSFYSVMIQPSSVTIRDMGVENFRPHHFINKDLTNPKIINQKYRKK